MKKDILNLSFEEALNELDEIVEKLENADIPLEDGILSHERADQLRRHCEKKLASAKLKIEKIISDNEDDEPVAEEVENVDLLAN